MRKPRFILFLVIIPLLITLSCDEKTDKIEISIIGENTSTMQAMMSIEEDYERENPNVDLKFHPNTFDDAFNKSNQDFANKTGLYDIVIQYNFSLSSFVENDYIHLLDEVNSSVDSKMLAFESDLFQNYWEELGYYYNINSDSDKDVIKVGYPSAALTMLLMYNKSMFEDSINKEEYFSIYNKELKIPSNWEDYYTVAEFFTNEDKGEKGVCIEGGPGGFLYFELMNFLGGLKGGKVLDSKRGWDSKPDTNVIVNSPENLEALKLYNKMKNFNSGQYSNVEQFEQMRIMKKGKTAMAFVWSDMIYPSLFAAESDNRFGFAEVPGNSSILGGGAYFVNKQTKNLGEVSKFINYLMQESTQVQMALNGFCSPLKTTYLNPEVAKLPYSEALAKSLDRADIALVAGIDSNMINEIITTYIQRCWNDELTEEEALEQIQSEITIGRKKLFSVNQKSN
ncbi:extracellular solute-binding protein [Winogradskyella tangerina]|uniref:extracellular solute-binding protein n=1 Tax=Winogradskyella tangerina TaxID=2023240 RepID=UPI000DBE8E99|nr:extracellular solute-binding protein [Winogradskyella tangerina]